MKELTIEQKARAYDEALERAMKFLNKELFAENSECAIKHIFPELAESEDERIREQIIYAINKLNVPESEKNKLLAWLEKQGEQKPIIEMITPEESLGIDSETYNDIVNTCIFGENKPKFKVGDWITNGACIIKITSVDDRYYWHDNDCVGGDIESIDKEYHLWTIKDAKDGDVLYYKDEISLYKHDIKNCTKQEATFGGFVYHCCYDGKRFIMDSLYSLTEQDKMDIHPATKEQRDLLFCKMHEAGYEWDEENKELKKIEQKPTNEPKFKIGDYIERKDGVGCHAKIIFVGGNFYGCEKLIYPEDESPFFEFMFENQDEFRVSSDFQQKPAWSEEDEKIYQSIIDDTVQENQLDDRQINWLKSLKNKVQPQNTWKPSIAQLNALSIVSKGNAPDDIEAIVSLYNDLKKLKGE